MGKIQKKRHKYHTPAVKEKKSEGRNVREETMEIEKATPSGIGRRQESIFSKVDIDMNTLQRASALDGDFDAKSAITNKSFKGLNLTKKEKKKMKHDFWLNKVDVIGTARKEEKERKKRKATAVVGDMQPLQDSLPTLELLFKNVRGSHASKDSDEKKTKGGTKREKVRKKEMIHDIDLFKQVLSHPAYKSSPLETVSEHLRNKIQQEQKKL